MKVKLKFSIRDVQVEVAIQNVVASARIEQNIDLKAVFRAFPDVDYRPEVFPGLAFKLERPKSSTLIFDNGKMICTGAKSERQARRAVLNVLREFRSAGIITSSKYEFTVQNIVATIEISGVQIDVEETAYAIHSLGEKVMYEPDQFSGAIYRMKDPKVVFLIFHSGKLVCAGAKREEEISRVVEKIITILDENKLLAR